MDGGVSCVEFAAYLESDDGVVFLFVGSGFCK